MPTFKNPLDALKHHVTGAIERGEAEPIVEVPATPTFQPGDKAKFVYPLVVEPELSGYSAHSGQIVEIQAEASYPENAYVSQRIYQIKAEDGWIGNAFEDELTPA